MWKSRNTVLYLIIFFALVLRLYGINQEIPHPDDYITVQAAMHYGLPQIAPTAYSGLYGLYVWPALFLVYMQVVFQTLYFFIGWVFGVFPDIQSFRNLYFTNPHSFYLIGRIICIGLGISTIWILYYLGKMVYNHTVGLLASLFLSVSFIHSFHSQFIRPDIGATFFIILVIISSIMILRKGNLKYYIYAGIFTGLSIVTKFTSGIVLVPIFIAHIMREKEQLFDVKHKFKKQLLLFAILIILGLFLFGGSLSVFIFDLFEWILIRFLPNIKPVPGNIELLKFLIRFIGAVGITLIVIGSLLIKNKTVRNFAFNLFGDRKLILSVVSMLLCFMIFDPIFFLDIKKQIYIFVTDSNFLGKYTNFVGVDGLGFLGNLWWYITGPISWGAGAHILVLAILGIFFTFASRKRENIIIILPMLVYMIAIFLGKYKWERYAVTLMPFIALYAASFLYLIYEKVSSKWPVIKNKIIIFLVITLIILFPTYNILRYDYLLSQKDTRVMSKEWIEKNLPPGSVIGHDAYAGEISDDLFQITRKFSLGISPFSYYIENGYQYLIVSDTQYVRYMAEPEKHPHQLDFYNSLFAKGVLIKTFQPRNLWPYPANRFTKYHIHISPTIKVFKINNSKHVQSVSDI